MLVDSLEPLFRQIAINPSGCTKFGSSAVKHWPRELLSGLERRDSSRSTQLRKFKSAQDVREHA
jgi:hypothetical protein